MKRAHARVLREIADVLEEKLVPGPQDSVIGVRPEWLQGWIQALAPKRRVRPRDPIRAAKKATVKELDALCREIVLHTSVCYRCMSTERLQWAHVFSRRYRWLRWDLSNSMALCAGCHLWWHHNPPAATAWLNTVLGETRYEDLKRRAARPQKTDLNLVRLHLMQEAKKLGVEVLS